MKKIKYEEYLESLGLCECLIPLIHFEIRQGNAITNYETNSNWPKKGCHRIYLKQMLHLTHHDFPRHPNIEAKYDPNIHYNWKSYAECLVHFHFVWASSPSSKE